ncbi:MAG TPA: DUF2938 domain-containing protein [Anaeromyxobacteraceae bacterium]|nr:DUF2938 domain-containing protein [Anaeromyxobacteraceae bacterium]
MTTTTEFVARSILIGIGATLTMDLWAAVLRRFGVPSLEFALLGRWIGHIPRGRLIHTSIARTPAVRGESLIGWSAHYAIGMTFGALLVATSGLEWARAPTLLPALFIGVVTVLAPLLVLQPALGAGIASSRTVRPVFNSVKSLVTHTVFAFGLFLTARVVASLLPAGT